MSDINIVIAGAAGQGGQSAAGILGKTLLRHGYHVFTAQDYQSRVRGGHNFMSIRFSDTPLSAPVARIDYLLALNEESIGLHLSGLIPDGRVLCMEESRGSQSDPRIRALAESAGPASARGEKFVAVKLSALLLAMLGFPVDTLSAAVKKMFDNRLSPEAVQANVDTAVAVAATVDARDVRTLTFKPSLDAGRMLLSGNEAVALGMMAAGLSVYSGYPMTPSSSLLEALSAAGPGVGCAVEQAEDEIAAINIAVGASYAGVRAACGSSGAGISLMTEGVGLSGITETPLVIYNGQRAGPAVGMATRTEQGDLLFMVHASHGEFPRAVISPADHDDSLYLAAEAFNIADRWQTPVFFTNDLGQAESECTVGEFDLSRVRIDRGLFAPEPAAPTVLPRYALTESGVSPRAVPALSDWIVACDSHEHDPAGHLTDNIGNRNQQHEKRMRKLKGMALSFPGPEIINPGKQICLITWGSTVGALLEARPLLAAKGLDFSVAVFRYLYPLDPLKIEKALAGFARLVTVEQNYSGQFGKLLRMECGITVSSHVGKYDGRLFMVEEMVNRLEPVLRGDA